MPLAAFGGTRAIMEQLAPLGPVYQAGTLSGNPVATACGLATLQRDRQARASSTRWRRSTRALVDGLTAAARAAGVPFGADCEGGMFGFFFADALPQNYAEVMASDKAALQPLLPRHARRAASTSRRRSTKPASSARRTAHDDIAATVAAAPRACV